MNVLFLTAELAGLAQTGGLADMARALPTALRELKHDVRVALPYYQCVARRSVAPVRLESLRVPMGNCDVWCAVREARLGDVPVYLVEHQDFFDRPNLYDDGLLSYPDNADRFAFFSKAALQMCCELKFFPDIVHVNDWTTALAPYFMKAHDLARCFRRARSVLTVHNAYFQGKCFEDNRRFIGIPDAHFNCDMFEDFQYLNPLKGGVRFADKINAVSPSYEAELLTCEGSHGLHEHFRRRAADMTGVLNGCDYALWNPETDPHIAANYRAADVANKVACKRDVQNRFGLEENPDRLLMGMVSRLTKQKGFEFLLPALREALREGASCVVLGQGDPSIEGQLEELVSGFPGRFGFRKEHDEIMARVVFAGADVFLMPSLYEPCGIAQMYAMRYGAVPLVRGVGGLKDTVCDCDESDGRGTGFVFYSASSAALGRCLHGAWGLYRNHREAFEAIRRRAMDARFEWRSVAEQYVDIYRWASEGCASQT